LNATAGSNLATFSVADTDPKNPFVSRKESNEARVVGFSNHSFSEAG
jgi:hypothetical protein